ncbi:7200_t:CDS:1, partial [Dentiscutata erythropus]
LESEKIVKYLLKVLSNEDSDKFNCSMNLFKWHWYTNFRDLNNRILKWYWKPASNSNSNIQLDIESSD